MTGQLKHYYIYMLECSNGAYYTGYTTNIERRYKEHQQGTSKSNFTKSFPPRKIAACWQVKGYSASFAMKIEWQIKQLSRAKKAHLIHRPELLKDLLDSKGLHAIVSLVNPPYES